MQQAVGQGEVGAGQRLQVQGGVARGRRLPGVDDDVLRAAGPALVEVLHRRRHGVGRVAAHQDDDVGGGDVLQREGHAAVEAERPVGRARRRGHAEAAVVVDGAGAQGDAGELAELVGLLVGQRAAAEAADGVAAVAWPGCARWRRPAGRARRPRWPRPAGWCGRPGSARTSGRSSRSGWSSSSVEDQPLEQRPPLLVGKSAGTRVAGRSPAVTVHAALQRAVGAVGQRRPRGPGAAGGGGGRHGGGHGTRVCRRRFPATAPASTLRSVVLTAGGRRLLGAGGRMATWPRVVEWRRDSSPSHRPADRRPGRRGPRRPPRGAAGRPADRRHAHHRPRRLPVDPVGAARRRPDAAAHPPARARRRAPRRLHRRRLGHRRRHRRRRLGAAGRRARHLSPARRRARRARPRAALPVRRPGLRRRRDGRPGHGRPAGRAALVAGPPRRPPDAPGGRGWPPRCWPRRWCAATPTGVLAAAAVYSWANVRFLRGFGFEVTAELRTADDELPVWVLVRRPLPTTGG